MTPNKPQKSVLPADAEKAIKKMIEIVCGMKELAEKETGVLGSGDLDALNELIALKEPMSKTYEKAGAEFHRRIAELKGVGPELLLELKAEQDALQGFMKQNSVYYEAARKARGGKK